MNDLLEKAASVFKSGNELMGSQWQNCEAEVIATQTIKACALNLKNHGEALSWLGNSARTGRQNCGTRNGQGLARLVREGFIVEETYEGSLKPSNPEEIHQVDGKYTVLRCTEKLLKYVIGFVK